MAAGRVEFSADSASCGPRMRRRSNESRWSRCSIAGVSSFSAASIAAAPHDPATDADLGDGFLMQRGFTLVWVGWEFDVRRQGGAMGIDVPAAQGITDVVRGDFTPNAPAERQTVGDLAGYTPLDPASAENRLVVRDGPFGPSRDRPDALDARGQHRHAQGRFPAGRTYELSYRAKNLPIAGLGMAAFRDVGSVDQARAGRVVRPRQTLAFGSSQSGRFLRTFLYYGFNTDEKGRRCSTPCWAHIAGAARTQPERARRDPDIAVDVHGDGFPFANQATRDPISGRTEGLLENERARQHQPKTFFTNTSVEYWGGGRSAALVHTSPDGKSDLALPDYDAGLLPRPARSTDRRAFRRASRRDSSPTTRSSTGGRMRALMVAMEQWVRRGPRRQRAGIPRLADGTLVPSNKVAFPAIPTVSVAAEHPGGAAVTASRFRSSCRRSMRTATSAPACARRSRWCRWRRTPAGTSGTPSIGGTDQLVSLLGSRVPLARTKVDRDTDGDPRPSVKERYPSRDVYVAKAQKVTDGLVKGGYLLSADASELMKRMEEQWAATVTR